MMWKNHRWLLCVDLIVQYPTTIAAAKSPYHILEDAGLVLYHSLSPFHVFPVPAIFQKPKLHKPIPVKWNQQIIVPKFLQGFINRFIFQKAFRFCSLDKCMLAIPPRDFLSRFTISPDILYCFNLFHYFCK